MAAHLAHNQIVQVRILVPPPKKSHKFFKNIYVIFLRFLLNIKKTLMDRPRAISISAILRLSLLAIKLIIPIHKGIYFLVLYCSFLLCINNHTPKITTDNTLDPISDMIAKPPVRSVLLRFGTTFSIVLLFESASES